MTTLSTSLAARFSSFAAIAALALSTVLATGCANGVDVDGTDGSDGPVADTSSEQTRMTTPELPALHDVAVLPKGAVPTVDPKNAFGHARRSPEPTAPAAKVRVLGDGIQVPSDVVAVPPRQAPRTVATPTLREMGEPIDVPSGFVADPPERVPNMVAKAEPAPAPDTDYEIPTGSPELALEAACDRDGRCPTRK